MNIGKVFKEARARKNITQKAMAQSLGLTPAALWKIEVGRNWPKQKTIEALCRETEMPLARVYIEAIEPEDYK